MVSPIILFVYNRPDHTRKTVEALSLNPLAKESVLYIYADGPKRDVNDENVLAVRRYLRTLPESGCFSSVNICESVGNKGLARSIIEGVSEILKDREYVIVLEDDLVVSHDFLQFMNCCLEFYQPHGEIGSVTGYSPLREMPKRYGYDVYAVQRNCSWGWGTWKDRWNQVDWDVTDFRTFRKDRNLIKQFDSCGSDRFDRLQRQLDGACNSWSIRFGYWQFRNGMRTVYPAISRVKNIGIDGSGTHGVGTVRFANELQNNMSRFTLMVPEINSAIERKFRKVYSGSFLTIISRRLRRAGLRKLHYFLKSVQRSIGYGQSC